MTDFFTIVVISTTAVGALVVAGLCVFVFRKEGKI